MPLLGPFFKTKGHNRAIECFYTILVQCAAWRQSGDSVSGGGGSYRGRGSNSTGGGWWGGGSMWQVRHMAALPQQKGALLLLSDGKCSLGWSRVCLHTELWKVRCFSFENDVRM